MDLANFSTCPVLYKPNSSEYNEKIRMFQGCPTIAVTKGGRIYCGWYSGGIGEPHMRNYNLLIYSDDQGKTWSKPLLVIPSSCTLKIHALDIQLFIDPDGALHVLWVQNNVLTEEEPLPKLAKNQPGVSADGYHFYDFKHSEWEVVCHNPDDYEPLFSEPRFLYNGFLRCKPTFLQNGDWLCFAYDQLTDCYGYYISHDSGKTFTHYYGAKKIDTFFDEGMAYQLDNGTIRMFARNHYGRLSECESKDNCITWSDTKLSDIVHADSRFFVKKLPSGRIILITNDDKARRKLSVSLSEDDGITWKYKKCIDQRDNLSYPDADFSDGKIYLTYDRGRTTEKEILFTSFSEDDIIEDSNIDISVISKPLICPKKEEVIQSIEENKLVVSLRNVPSEKLLKTAEALYCGGVRLIEVPYCDDEHIGDEEIAEQIRILAEHFYGKMLIGAGSVVTQEQVRKTKEVGGAFIISPNTNKMVIFESHICGLVSIPGAFTPSEIKYADECGADFVKLFPISCLGETFVRTVKAPFSKIKLFAVGGVDESNLESYINAGVCGIGAGSCLVRKDWIEKEDYSSITALAKTYIEVIGNCCLH